MIRARLCPEETGEQLAQEVEWKFFAAAFSVQPVRPGSLGSQQALLPTTSFEGAQLASDTQPWPILHAAGNAV